MSYLTNFSKVLNAAEINMENYDHQSFSIPQIYTNRYGWYKYHFLASVASEGRTSEEVFIDTLTSNAREKRVYV